MVQSEMRIQSGNIIAAKFTICALEHADLVFMFPMVRRIKGSDKSATLVMSANGRGVFVGLNQMLDILSHEKKFVYLNVT